MTRMALSQFRGSVGCTHRQRPFPNLRLVCGRTVNVFGAEVIFTANRALTASNGPPAREAAANIRVATMYDAAALAIFALKCNLDWDEAALQKECGRDLGIVLIATSGAQACAILIAWLIADEVQILEMAVSPSLRRQRIATRLISALLSDRRLHEAAAATAWLEVSCNNAAALSLYRSLGFQKAGVRRGYFADGSDALTMRLDLEPTTSN